MTVNDGSMPATEEKKEKNILSKLFDAFLQPKSELREKTLETISSKDNSVSVEELREESDESKSALAQLDNVKSLSAGDLMRI